jgi:WD40 repeat protein
MARVALSFDAWKPGQVAPATVEVPVHVPEAVASPELQATLRSNGESVGTVTFSPDGQTLASLSFEDKEVKLWDVADRKERTTLKSDLGQPFGLAFTPDGKTLITTYYASRGREDVTGGIVLWDVATGRRRSVLQNHTPPWGVTQLACSPDGKTIAAWEFGREKDQKAIKQQGTLWDLAAGKVRAVLPDERCTAVTFSPDGKILLHATYHIKDNQLEGIEIKRWDVAAGKELPALVDRVNKNPLRLLAYSPDGKALVGLDYRGVVHCYEPAGGSERHTLTADGKREVASFAISSDGKLLALAVGNSPGQKHEPGLVALYDLATLHKLATFTGHTDAVLSVAFASDGRTLASGSSDGTIRLWDISRLPAVKVSAGEE